MLFRFVPVFAAFCFYGYCKQFFKSLSFHFKMRRCFVLALASCPSPVSQTSRETFHSSLLYFVGNFLIVSWISYCEKTLKRLLSMYMFCDDYCFYLMRALRFGMLYQYLATVSDTAFLQKNYTTLLEYYTKQHKEGKLKYRWENFAKKYLYLGYAEQFYICFCF